MIKAKKINRSQSPCASVECVFKKNSKNGHLSRTKQRISQRSFARKLVYAAGLESFFFLFTCGKNSRPVLMRERYPTLSQALGESPVLAILGCT